MASVRRFASVVLLCLVVAGCGGKKAAGGASARDAGPSDPYHGGLAALAKLEGEALDSLAAHMGDHYTSDEDLVAALQKTAIPRYTDFVAGLTKLVPPPDKAALHQKLLTLAQGELAALQKLADAVAHGDGNTVLEVNREQRRLGDEIDALLASWTGVPPSPPPPAPGPDAAPAAAQPAPPAPAPPPVTTSTSDANVGSK
jgi:hypothetical protein